MAANDPIYVGSKSPKMAISNPRQPEGLTKKNMKPSKAVD